MTITYTVREPLLCDYIATFESDVELDYQGVLDRSNELTSQGKLDWEPEWDAHDDNRSFSISKLVGNTDEEFILPTYHQDLLNVGIDPDFVARYISPPGSHEHSLPRAGEAGRGTVATVGTSAAGRLQRKELEGCAGTAAQQARDWSRRGDVAAVAKGWWRL